MTESNQHSDLVETIRAGFHQSEIEPMDEYHDALDSLIEQHEALLAEWRDYKAMTEDIIVDLQDQKTGLHEQLETLRRAAQDYRTLVSPQYEGVEWEAAEALDAALGSNPARSLHPGEADGLEPSETVSDPASSPPANPSYVGPPDYPDSNPASEPQIVDVWVGGEYRGKTIYDPGVSNQEERP